jgi:hypothetical protein
VQVCRRVGDGHLGRCPVSARRGILRGKRLGFAARVCPSSRSLPRRRPMRAGAMGLSFLIVAHRDRSSQDAKQSSDAGDPRKVMSFDADP